MEPQDSITGKEIRAYSPEDLELVTNGLGIILSRCFSDYDPQKLSYLRQNQDLLVNSKMRIAFNPGRVARNSMDIFTKRANHPIPAEAFVAGAVGLSGLAFLSASVIVVIGSTGTISQFMLYAVLILVALIPVYGFAAQTDYELYRNGDAIRAALTVPEINKAINSWEQGDESHRIAVNSEFGSIMERLCLAYDGAVRAPVDSAIREVKEEFNSMVPPTVVVTRDEGMLPLGDGS